MNGTIYNLPLISDPDTFIAIKHGETSYYKTTSYTQSHADVLNSRQGLSPADLSAAESCSMFGCWDNFDTIKASSIKHGVSGDPITV